MDLLLAPFNVMRRDIAVILVPAIPILFLMVFLVLPQSGWTQMGVLNQTDRYLGGTLYLSAANITAFDSLAADLQMPLVRLGGIADRTNIREFTGGSMVNFLLIFVTLTLGFLSYAMVSRAVYAIRNGQKAYFGTKGINASSIALSAIAAFFLLFICSFSLGGFKLMLVVSFGAYFTFAIPFAATGQPVGESIFQGFKFLSQNMPKMIACYICCVGAAIMIPVGMLVFLGPLIMNLEPGMTTTMRTVMGLFAIMFGLFYQMALCASVALPDKPLPEKAPT
jgi:hypothetical protein